MEDNMYYLMHRDTPVCVISIDAASGAMLRVSSKKEQEFLPPGGCQDVQMLRKWWQRRAVPLNQGKIQWILERLGIASTQSLLTRNLGLSLTDHYWIKPLGMELEWRDINLFTNDFRDPIGDIQMEENAGELWALPENVFSPSSSVQGELRKKWMIIDGERYLLKGNHGSTSQESLNEVAATLLHKKQNVQPYVSYGMMKREHDRQIYCVCKSFTSDAVEFIPAIDVVDSRKKKNAVSLYEHFIHVCAEHGLKEEITRPFLEYQILTDFILTNTDRHLNNFGVLRDSSTLQFIGMAPIFDSGNSMFWNQPYLPEKDDLTNISVNSFRQRERELLRYVQDVSPVNLEKLPTEEELRYIYQQDAMISHVDSILLGYRKKIAALEKYYNQSSL